MWRDFRWKSLLMQRVQVKYPPSGFLGSLAMKPLENLRVFFCLVTYLLTMGVGKEKSEILNEKKMTPSLFENKKSVFLIPTEVGKNPTFSYKAVFGKLPLFQG